MISCGLQCINCPYPIHLDTYSGCSHACRYCFANEKNTIRNIRPLNNASALKAFIDGHRTLETKWCDWDIPIHWGANSDPFQAYESEHKRTLECLRIFADTHYPFTILAPTEGSDLKYIFTFTVLSCSTLYFRLSAGFCTRNKLCPEQAK